MILRTLFLTSMVMAAGAMHKSIAFPNSNSVRVLKEPRVISEMPDKKEMRMSSEEMEARQSKHLPEPPIPLAPLPTPAPVYPGPHPTPSAIHGLKPKSLPAYPGRYHPSPAPYHHPSPAPYHHQPAPYQHHNPYGPPRVHPTPYHGPTHAPHGPTHAPHGPTHAPHHAPSHPKVTYPAPHPTPTPYHQPAREYHPTPSPIPHRQTPPIPPHHLPVPAAPIHHPAPRPIHHPTPSHPVAHPAPYHEPYAEENHSPKNYAFGYSVKDDYTGDDYSHKESRDGYMTSGEYRVALPDGRIQIVTYHADENGYVADVKYEGVAVPYVPQHPPAHHVPVHHSPLPPKPYLAPLVHHKPAPVGPPPPRVTPAPPPPAPKPTEKPIRLYRPTTPIYTPTPPHHPTPTPYHPAPTPKYGYKPYHPEPKTSFYNPVPVIHPAPKETVLHELKPRKYHVPKHLGHHAPIPKLGYIPTPAPYHGLPTAYPTPYPKPDVYRPKEDPYLAAKKAAGKIGVKVVRRKGVRTYGGYIG